MAIVDTPCALIYITTYHSVTMETGIAATGVRALRVNATRLHVASVRFISAFIDVVTVS